MKKENKEKIRKWSLYFFGMSFVSALLLFVFFWIDGLLPPTETQGVIITYNKFLVIPSFILVGALTIFFLAGGILFSIWLFLKLINKFKK